MTRRTVALSLAVAMVWVTPVVGGTSSDAPPDASLRSITVDRWSTDDGAARSRSMAGGSAPSWSTSAVVDAGDAVLVGADWGGDADTTVQVRADDGAGWGEWIDLAVHDEHAPDATSAEAEGVSTASEPVWVGRVEHLQFRAEGGLDDLDVDLVDIAGDLDYEPDAAGRGAAVAAPDAPFIRPRSYWGADESLRSSAVSYSDDVRFSVVHHEGGVPRWSPEDIAAGCKEAAAAINSIYEYHTRGRGYWDIAYNFVVDPCGRVWEGRAGGVDRAVMGAHAGGWNGGSVGVLALGTFQPAAGKPADPVTDDLVQGIEDLLAWKLDLHHTDPRGTTREISGGGSSRYASGTAVNVPILSAHQITNSTGCPGENLMERLFSGRAGAGSPRSSYVQAVHGAGLPKAFDSQPARWTASEQGDRPDWDVHFSEALDWSLRITDEDDRLVRATGGVDELDAERTWDLRDGNGDLVDAGTYTATITGTGPSGEITPVVTDLVVSPTVSRRQGEDRIATSVALSRWAFDEADVAIVASAQAYPDALVSGPMAGSLDAPVLLTGHDDLPEGVQDEIERLGASRVYVIGGTVAVGAGVQDELEAEMPGVTVERIGGADRFATAAMVADRVVAAAPSTEVLLSLGRHEDENRAFPDALSAGAFGADLTLPVLLTNGDSLPTATRAALADLAPETVTVFGGPVAITDAVEGRVRRVTGATVDRFAGETRYDTSRMAAEALLERRGVVAPGAAADQASEEPSDPASEEPTAPASEGADAIDLIFASGGNWPDALGAGAAAAQTGTLFLLAHPQDLDDGAATRSFLERWSDRIGSASVAGGPVAIKSRVITAIAGYVSSGDRVVTEPIDWPRDPHGGSGSTGGGSASPTASASPSESASPSTAPSEEPSPTETATGP